MQWGLPKGTLKDVWAAVAGDEGSLSQQQFVQCLYLMDNAKRVRIACHPQLHCPEWQMHTACLVHLDASFSFVITLFYF